MQSENLKIWAERYFALRSSNFRLGVKLVLWFSISLALSLIFFRDFWASLGTMLSPSWIFGQQHVAPWGVLALCFIWLWLKRKVVWKEMNRRASFVFIIPGLALVVGAILVPSSLNFMVFKVLLASLGVFVILFGWGAGIPSILISIYGFAISFPLIIGRFADLPYSMSALKPVMWIMTTIGYPLGNQGQWIHFTSSAGEPVSLLISAGCAGPATMAVFMAIFALMMLDAPLQPRKAIFMFLFGVGGTWLQNVIRLIILMMSRYYFGESAMWTAHTWVTYIMFPLWYLLFVYIYFRQVEGRSGKLKLQEA